MFLELNGHGSIIMLKPHPYFGGKWNVFQKDLQFIDSEYTIDVGIQLIGASADFHRSSNGNYVDLILHCF